MRADSLAPVPFINMGLGVVIDENTGIGHIFSVMLACDPAPHEWETSDPEKAQGFEQIAFRIVVVFENHRSIAVTAERHPLFRFAAAAQNLHS